MQEMYFQRREKEFRKENENFQLTQWNYKLAREINDG